jgi:hypothetical protein
MAFDYKFPVPPSDPHCANAFQQTFHHKDWIDGQDVVQAGATADEDGFNLRFQRIESDIAALNSNLANAFACINVLRAQLAEVLAEIKTQLNPPPAKKSKEGKDVKDFKDGKDGKDGKDTKDSKDGKDGKDTKDSKDAKDGKDGKDAKDAKDTKDSKDGKDHKDGKEKEGKEAQWGAAEKRLPERIQRPALSSGFDEFLWRADDAASEGEPVGRAFIRPEERPPVGERALQDAEEPART